MKGVRFWGTRGSLPVSLTAHDVRSRIVHAMKAANGRTFASDAEIEAYVDSLDFPARGTFGGHSSCVEIITGRPEYVICDLGSGVRPLGQAAIARHGPKDPQTYHVLMSHVHWDHIMGLPFFVPAYIPGNRLFIYGCHEELESALRRQMEPPSFPVPFSFLKSDIEFVRLEPGVPRQIAGMTVTSMRQHHTGDSYGYRFEDGDRCVVYSTDSEHKLDDPAETQAFRAFFDRADLVIFDGMYSLADAMSVKADWGHSSNVVGVELCQYAQVKHLCLFHHEPASDDAALAKLLAETQQLEEITRTGAPLRISAAYDGLEIML